MSAQTPSSYVQSITVHAVAVGLMLAFTLAMHENVRAPAETIQLVAGEGDNYAATEAPAIGTPDGDPGLKMPEMPATMPKIPDPSPEPEPAQMTPVSEPQPEPVQETAPEPVKEKPVEKTPPKETVAKAADKPSPLDTKKTTYKDDLKRLSEKRFNRKINAWRKEQAAAEARAAKEAERRMTEADFRKAHGGAGTTGSGKAAVRINAKGIAGGVVGGSTSNTTGGAGGKALSVTEQRLMDQYWAFFKQKLKQVHEAPPGVGPNLVTVVSFHLSASGAISAVRIEESSGNPDFDRSVLSAFSRMRPIGAPPDGNAGDFSLDVESRDSSG